MLETYWRRPARKVLLRLLHWIETETGQPVTRGGGQRFWEKEIQLPSYVIAAFSVAAFFVVLLFEIGLSWTKIIGLVLFLAMIFSFFILYLRRDEPKVLADSEAVMLLGLLFISAVLLMQLVKEWHAVSPDWISPLAAPIAIFTLLTGLLLSRNLAFVVGLVLSLIFGTLNDFSLEYFIVNLFSSLLVVVILPRIRNRADLTRLGLKLALMNVTVIVIIHFFKLWPMNTFRANVISGAFSGFISALVVLALLPVLESFFSRTTNIKLLELADFNQPLLKRLMIEAPGTYHHSLIMASLAEQAAEAIGENSLLARVGAYYHDIGKLSNPGYFIENQQATANPHDPLTPTMSSLVVISHVKEGVVLSRQHKLDRVIIEFIEQHHGTSLIHYFYHRALEQNADIKQDSFRYPGPQPQSKVAAILMISDAVEAASRTVEEPSPSRLKDVVQKVINNKFTDGQFSQCPITLQDLNNIADTMVTTLSGIYHARIEYQKTENEN